MAIFMTWCVLRKFFGEWVQFSPLLAFYFSVITLTGGSMGLRYFFIVWGGGVHLYVNIRKYNLNRSVFCFPGRGLSICSKIVGTNKNVLDSWKPRNSRDPDIIHVLQVRKTRKSTNSPVMFFLISYCL